MSLSDRDQKVIWHPYTQMQLAEPAIAILRGEGALLFDEQGKEYIDAISSWWVNLHGHSHPHIAKKVAAQLETLEHVIFADFTHPGAVELAERLLKKLPENQRRIFYSDNGSTAVEVALKMSFQYWSNNGSPKTKVIAFKNAYHGDTFGSMAVSGRSAFTAPFQQFLFDVHFIDVPVPGMEISALNQLEEYLQKEGDSVAAFIFEPLIQGAGGMQMYGPEALDTLISVCRKYNTLVIADEVMTGFGRTGRFFASDYLKEKPDIMCLSKGLTGGTMALGVTSCTNEIYAAFLSEDKLKTFFHGHSFTANPVACASALASLDLMEEKSTSDNIQKIGVKHAEFASALKSYNIIKEVRQRGTIIAIELNPEGETSYFHSLRDTAYRFLLNKGVLMRPLGNIIYIMPPYCITDKQLQHVYTSIKDLLDHLGGGKK